MKKQKGHWVRGMSFLLAAAMLSTGNLSTVADAAAQKQWKNRRNEAQLRRAVRDGKRMVKEYPDGLFNFLGTQMEVKEGGDALEIAVIRQGGTRGSAEVTFKAIDITASYGEDYEIYTGKSRFSALKKGKNAFPLIQAAMEKTVDLSREDGDETKGQDGEKKMSDTAASVQLLGKNPDQSEKTREVKENFQLFMNSVGGTETTLHFKEGEYVKYLYLVPKDDKIPEGEEQLVCALLPKGNVPVGDSYHAYVNIKDNDAAEASRYAFENPEVKASGKKGVVTIKRTAGEQYFDTVYVGTGEGTANQGADYKAGVKKVEFYAGETEKKVSIDILKNKYRRESRDFYVLLSEDGSSYNKESCHVIIPAASDGNAKAVTSENGVEPAKAEKISPNGWKPEDGQWAVPAKDMQYLQGNIRRQNAETRFEGTGGLRVMKLKQGDYTYGAEALEFGCYNYGNGKHWTTGHREWSGAKGEMTSVTDEHHEEQFGMQLWYGSRCVWQKNGTADWNVYTIPFENGQWGKDVTIKNWAGEGNHSNGSVGWLRLRLKQYNISCEGAENGEPGVSLKIDSITSNAGSSQDRIKSTSAKVYRSDAIRFELENFNDDEMNLDGIEASVDGKKWIEVSEGSSLCVVLNADFFKKFDLFQNSRISFRPRVTVKTGKKEPAAVRMESTGKNDFTKRKTQPRRIMHCWYSLSGDPEQSSIRKR